MKRGLVLFLCSALLSCLNVLPARATATTDEADWIVSGNVSTSGLIEDHPGDFLVAPSQNQPPGPSAWVRPYDASFAALGLFDAYNARASVDLTQAQTYSRSARRWLNWYQNQEIAVETTYNGLSVGFVPDFYYNGSGWSSLNSCNR